jgi:hypothetical protein
VERGGTGRGVSSPEGCTAHRRLQDDEQGDARRQDGSEERHGHDLVLGSRSSWKDGDGQVTLYDTQAKKVTTYGGKSKEKVAQQRPIPENMGNWELGYQAFAANSSVPPKEGAKAKYGGEACTILQFDTRSFGKPELCVTDKGIVARYAERGADGSETIYEAEKITTSAPSRDAFEIPPGFELKD